MEVDSEPSRLLPISVQSSWVIATLEKSSSTMLVHFSKIYIQAATCTLFTKNLC